MRFSLKDKVHRQFLRGWDSDETDRLSENSEKKEDSDWASSDNESWYNRFSERRKQRQGARSRLMNMELVDEAFDTKPPVVSAPTTFLMPEDDIEMTLYEGDYPSMNIRSEAAAVKPALLTTPPKPRLIKPVPRRMQYVDDSAKDASVDQKASSSQQDTIKDEELVKVLRDNGMKVHYLDFANISPSKRIRRHYWVTPASNEPETGNVLRSKLIEDTLAELRRRSHSPPRASK